MKRLFIPLFSLFSLVGLAQDWSLSLSSNVDLRTWKLSTKADKEEKGLNGASIKLYRGTEVISEMASSGNGDFKINVPANGDFILEVSYPGCNTKKFAISTKDVPENISKDNFKPTYSIGGFIMAKPLPGVDYAYLSQPLVKVVYAPRGQKFEDDGSTTDRSLKAMSKIAEAENKLIEKFCLTNREGDGALSKPDCALAKTLYEKALTQLPGESYPTQQLTKADKCIKDKEAADKKAAEAAVVKTPTVAAPSAKDDANKKAIEEAVAKAKADKATKDQALNDQLVLAAADQARKKATSEKIAADNADKTKPIASAPQPTTAANPKSPIKVKEKTGSETEAEKRKAGLAKSQAEDDAAIKADAEKAAAKREEKSRKAQEGAVKQKEEDQKAQDEKKAKQKEEAQKQAADQKAKAEEDQKKRAEQQAKDKEEARKEAADKAAQAQKDQDERDKDEAERAAKEKEARKKTYEKIEQDYATGKSKSDHSLPPVLGSGDNYKTKIAKADDHLSNKRYKEAKMEYEGALKLKPNDEYATSRLAEVNKLLTP